MKPSEIISLARRQSGCSEDVVTVAEAYKFLNFVIEDFGAEIRLSDSGYGLQTKTISLVAGQNKYTYQTESAGTSGTDPVFAIDKIIKVGILKQGGDYEEIPVRFVNEIDINRIEYQGGPKMCFYDGTSLIFTPTPKESYQAIIYGYNKNFEIPTYTISTSDDTYERYYLGDVSSASYKYAWNKGTAVRYTDSQTPSVGDTLYNNPGGTGSTQAITAVNDTDLESNIWIPSRWHHIIVEGMKYRMYGNMGSNFDSLRIQARNFYDSEKLKAIQQLTDRGQMAEEQEAPYLDNLG